MNSINRILTHQDTRTIPCITKKCALSRESMSIDATLSQNNPEDDLGEFLQRISGIIGGKDQKNDVSSSPIKVEINSSLDNYFNLFEKKWGSQFDSLQNKSFIAPRSTTEVEIRNDGWKKDPSSGRSYYFVLDDLFMSVINKGADLLKGDKFRKYPETYFAPPMIGSVTLKELEREYLNAGIVQEFSLRLQGMTTWAPEPVQLNELNNFILESGEVVPFEKYLNEARKDKSISLNIFKSLFRAGIDCLAVPPEHRKKPFEWAIGKYLETLGSHGTYLYTIKGLNTRLIDSERIEDKSKLKEIIRKQYPNCKNEAEICDTFMERLAEYYGITQGLGFTYKDQSECLLVDTTLGGVTMDIGDLQLNANQEAYINSFLASKSTSLYFYNLFFPASKNGDTSFLKSFEKSFVKNLMSYMRISNKLIKDKNLSNKVSKNISSLETQIDELIKLEGLPLRTKFIALNN